MPDDECMRRIGDFNAMEIRLRILEEKNLNLKISHEDHGILIERLLDQDAKAVIALNSISSKFDALIAQFSLGFKILCVCGGIVTTMIAGFWVYSHDLDQRYSPKVEQLVNNSEIQKQASVSNSAKLNEVKANTTETKANTEEQAETIQEQIDKLEKLKQEMSAVKSLKVIQASKPGRRK